MVYEYSWSGYQWPVKASDVAHHLERLEQEEGAVTKYNFLDSARSEESGMHNLFEWDDYKAAERYRLHQADMIICGLRVTVQETQESAPKTLRAFVNVSGERQGAFINIRKALGKADTRDKVLDDARRDLERFRNKYNTLANAEALFAAIDDFLEMSA